MINILIKEVSKFLPLTVTEIEWIDPSLVINGINWSLSNLGSWRILSKNEIICGCYDDNSYEELKKLISMKIYLIEVQSSHVEADPIFYLIDEASNTLKKLEIFSTTLIEPWIFQSPDHMIYIPFERSLKKKDNESVKNH